MVSKGSQHAGAMYGGNCFMLTIDCVLQPAALLCAEPFRVTRFIGHHGQEHETKEDRRHPLDDEEPLPALQATPNPSIWRIAVESGAPTASETGIATMKAAMIRAR